MTGSRKRWIKSFFGFFIPSELVKRIRKSKKDNREKGERMTPCWEGWFSPLGLVNR
jgi:hypothetical protein